MTAMVICKLGWPVGVNFRANNEGYDGSQTSKARSKSSLFRTAACSESCYQSMMVSDWMEIRYRYEKMCHICLEIDRNLLSRLEKALFTHH